MVSTQKIVVVAIIIINKRPEGFYIDQNGDTASSKDRSWKVGTIVLVMCVWGNYL